MDDLRPMRVLMLCLSLVALQASAQLRTGPRVGASLATISAGGLFSWNGLPKPGPIVGWSFEIPWTAQASFLVEPMYMSKGSLVQNAQLRTFTSVRLGYLELPVMFKISTDTLPDGFFLTAGGMFGWWMNGRTVTRQDGNVLFESSYTLQGTANRSQVSVGIGFGWDRPRSRFELRYQTSITPFSTVLRGQNLVAGLHYTYLLPTATRQGKEEE
jgi:hypothetical protein